MDLATTSRTRRRSVHRATGGRRWPKRVLIGAIILLVLALIGGIGGWFYLNAVLNSVRRFQVSTITPETSGAPIDILLIGSDSRAFVSDPGEAAAFGNPLTQSGQRSDVIIVVRLVPKTRQIEMLSIPRDTYVPIPPTGASNRINAAFNTGPSVLVKTIQQDFGIPINHVVVANFPGFEGMVNAIGGISLDFSDPLRDQYSGLSVNTVGCQTVNGATALALVRSRHLYYLKNGAWNYDGMSDWSRIQRQQAFFRAVINKVNGEFPNVVAMIAFLRATAHDLSVDKGFTAHEMISLGLRFRGVAAGQLMTRVLPTHGIYIDGNAVLIAAQPYAKRLVASFLSLGAPPKSGGPGASATSSTHPGPSTTAPIATTTVPADQVVFDNSKTLPEPWNPKPC